jgi:hypothetical protein
MPRSAPATVLGTVERVFRTSQWPIAMMTTTSAAQRPAGIRLACGG